MQEQHADSNVSKTDVKSYILLYLLVMACPPIGLIMGGCSIIRKTDWRRSIGVPVLILSLFFSAFYIYVFVNR